MKQGVIGEVGGWTFYEGELGGRTVYGFAPSVPDGTAAGRPRIHEWYESIEHAMAAAIAEKYTGRRGAGGTAVGTAADWFMEMIGANKPTRAELIERVDKGLTPIIAAVDSDGSNRHVAEQIVDALDLDLRP